MNIAENTAYIRFLGFINIETASAVADACMRKIEEGASRIHLALKSPGGDGFAGHWLHDHLKELPVPLTTHGRTIVHSAAVAPFLAGQERLLEQDCTVLIHPVRWKESESDLLEGFGLSFEKLKLLFAETSSGILGEIGLTREQIEGLTSKESLLSADEAIALGIAQRIQKIELPPGAEWTDLLYPTKD